MKHIVIFCMGIFVLVGCGKDGLFGNLSGAQPGWTPDSIKRYIGCEPVESKHCKCTVDLITKKYTPDQVKEKSPIVAADMLMMSKSCDGSLVAMEKPTSGTSTKPPSSPVGPKP